MCCHTRCTLLPSHPLGITHHGGVQIVGSYSGVLSGVLSGVSGVLSGVGQGCQGSCQGSIRDACDKRAMIQWHVRGVRGVRGRSHLYNYKTALNKC